MVQQNKKNTAGVVGAKHSENSLFIKLIDNWLPECFALTGK
jgi:hypothetical protein